MRHEVEEGAPRRPPTSQTVNDSGSWERAGLQPLMRNLGRIARRDQGPKSGGHEMYQKRGGEVRCLSRALWITHLPRPADGACGEAACSPTTSCRMRSFLGIGACYQQRHVGRRLTTARHATPTAGPECRLQRWSIPWCTTECTSSLHDFTIRCILTQLS